MRAQAGRAVVVVGVERVIRQVARDNDAPLMELSREIGALSERNRWLVERLAESDRQLTQALEDLQREREDASLFKAVSLGEA